MRIDDHPILSFPETDTVTFTYEGKEIAAKKGETIAAALHNEGIIELRRSGDKQRPRGLFCAIGKCSSCLMKVDGVPNVRTCITMASEGMRVEKQNGFPELPREVNDLKPGSIDTAEPDLLVVGGGPAGLKSGLVAAEAGADVIIVDENPFLGGQLIKQTHKFFGSSEQEAGIRGVDIGEELVERVERHKNIKSMTSTSSVGIYEDTVGVYKNMSHFQKINPRKTIIATGATEDMITFPNNDLPGIYGAGGVQTLMNVYGVKPGEKVVMVGAGNVGLIVSYQLLQAGVDVEAIVEIAPRIGGYFVHAAKLRRFGVPILTGHRVLEVEGKERVEKVKVAETNGSGGIVQGSVVDYEVDILALAVGLSPSYKLLGHAGCELQFQPQLGGYVPTRNERMETTVGGLYVAGDAAGIEEATSALLEGTIAGADVGLKIGEGGKAEEDLINDSQEKLSRLRAGPFYRDLRESLKEVGV
ncbi:FAD-dependent oxidoreductase [Candidatus Bipolaricaulota bacterium]|nr:FAD-dependent oxidoreductase [Candidatus Bipolaricaulota bacterium]MBS3814582.1 FAD-dependent oxidoreductase [Candidatus Bipolaricaulota bacterium]MBS3825687.1 FAD-dependent oxidoreductase [Candidatus Bipolaricaulota bacterium]